MFIFLLLLSWPMICSGWWDANLFWITSNKKRLDFFTKKDERLERILREVQGIASFRGFPDLKIDIRLVKPFIITFFDGEAYYPSVQRSIIFIFECHLKLKEYDDDDLRILIAHEFGHVLDKRTRRRGHPILERTKRFGKEEFANFIAIYLYSKGMFFESAKRCGQECESLERLARMDFTELHSIRKTA